MGRRSKGRRESTRKEAQDLTINLTSLLFASTTYIEKNKKRVRERKDKNHLLQR
jgi:hypothetical protein